MIAMDLKRSALCGVVRAARTPNAANRRRPIGVKDAKFRLLASIWRPNWVEPSLLFSIGAACKLLIFLAWGARGPEFKSRRPDQIPHRLTDTRNSRHPS